MNNQKIKGTVTLCLLLAVLLFSALPSALSAQVDPVLPPRPTPDPAAAVSTPIGSTIMLEIPVTIESSIDADDWTVVQWQDNHGDWNDVEGWQGNLAYDSASKSWQAIWWVARANFGEKSFRWVVYSDDTMGNLEATSETFDLPVSQWQGVVVSLEP